MISNKQVLGEILRNTKNRKFIVLFITILIITGYSCVACDSNSNVTDIHTQALEENQGCSCSDIPSSSGSVPFGLRANITVEKAPKTRELVHIQWCLTALEDFKELHAWIQFDYDSGKTGDSRKLPLDEQKETMLLDGHIDYIGSMKTGEEKYFDADIKFPMEGEWRAGVYFLGRSVDRDLTQGEGAGIPYSTGTGDVVQLYVTDEYGSAVIPDYKTGLNMIHIPNDSLPISGYVDIYTPPVLDTLVEINWGFGTTTDVEQADVSLIFVYDDPDKKNNVEFTFDQLYVDGDKPGTFMELKANESFKSAFDIPAWRIMDKSILESLIENSTYYHSSEIVFSEAGNWSVILVINGSGVYSLSFYVSEKDSHWGWK